MAAVINQKQQEITHVYTHISEKALQNPVNSTVELFHVHIQTDGDQKDKLALLHICDTCLTVDIQRHAAHLRFSLYF
jgi:hypothetical protein